MNPSEAERVETAFRRRVGSPSLLVQSPGRVNLIGEHTDYNLGFVLPGAVDRGIWFALRPRTDGRCVLHSLDFDVTVEVGLSNLVKSDVLWANYMVGVLAGMVDQGLQPRGVDCVFGGDIPRGSGMSSSAALSCGFAFGVNELFGLGLDRVALAWLGRDAEHRFAGVKCGIMDQFASLLGKHGKLIRLDCRTLDFAYVPFERSDLRVLLCDSQVRRELAGSEYNLRRGQCGRGVTILSGHYPGVASLRDATSEMLAAHRSEFDPVVYRRCAYVIEENQRVGKACEALAASDFAEFGALMNESHRGLSTEYEVSSVELDVLAEAARLIPGVQGSRMMGAGFGGCTINLVEEAAAPDFHQRMAVVFRAKLGKEPVIHECRIAGGTHVPSAEHSAYSTVRTAV